jgi:hypothetical protein
VKPQANQLFGECYQVTESGVTEPAYRPIRLPWPQAQKTELLVMR